MRQTREAYKLFEKLKSEGVCANAVTYNILIGSYCKEGLFEEACALLNRGVASGLTPNFVTWHILVSYMSKRVLRRINFSSLIS